MVEMFREWWPKAKEQRVVSLRLQGPSTRITSQSVVPRLAGSAVIFLRVCTSSVSFPWCGYRISQGRHHVFFRRGAAPLFPSIRPAPIRRMPDPVWLRVARSAHEKGRRKTGGLDRDL